MKMTRVDRLSRRRACSDLSTYDPEDDIAATPAVTPNLWGASWTPRSASRPGLELASAAELSYQRVQILNEPGTVEMLRDASTDRLQRARHNRSWTPTSR